MMTSERRYLVSVRHEQIRLGWLNVLVQLIGEQRMSLKELGERLREVEPHFDQWWENSGLVAPPKGNIGPHRREQTLHILNTYKLYDKDFEQLTELGLLLQWIRRDTLTAEGNPFKWEGAARWLGLWIFLHATADVVFPLLLTWTEPIKTVQELAQLISARLISLTQHENNPDARDDLRMQADRIKQKDVARQLVYPYLEPLRELGFIQVVKDATHSGKKCYCLSADGKLMLQHLQRTPRATAELLKQHLSRWLLAMILPEHPLSVAQPSDLQRALQALPSALTRGNGREVNVALLVPYVQTFLIQHHPGRWISEPRLSQLISLMKSRSQDAISTKRALTVSELHLSWSESSLLDDDALWSDEGASFASPEWIQAVESPPLRHVMSTVISSTVPSEETPGTHAPEHTYAPEHTHAPEHTDTDTHMRPDEDPVEGEAQPTALEVAYVRESAQSSAIDDADTMAIRAEEVAQVPTQEAPSAPLEMRSMPFVQEIPLNKKLWLQLLEELCHPSAQRDVTFAPKRGLIGSIRHLHLLTLSPPHRLSSKRKKNGAQLPPALDVMEQLLPHLKNSSSAIPEAKLLQIYVEQLLEAWTQEHHPIPRLGVLLTDMFERRSSFFEAMHKPISDFCQESSASSESVQKKWPAVEAFTRSLFYDGLELGMMSPSDLEEMQTCPQDLASAEVAIQSWLRWLHLGSETLLHFSFECELSDLMAPHQRTPVEHVCSHLGAKLSMQYAPAQHPTKQSSSINGEEIRELEDVTEQPTMYVLSGDVWAHTRSHAQRLVTFHLSQVSGSAKSAPIELYPLNPSSAHPPHEDTQESCRRYTSLPLMQYDSSPSVSAAIQPLSSPLSRVVHLEERIKRAERLLNLSHGHEPSSQLSMAWSAFEQLFSGGEEHKVNTTVELATPVLVLQHLSEVMVQLLRDVRYALSTSLLRSFGKSIDAELLKHWLGEEAAQALDRVSRGALGMQVSWFVSDQHRGHQTSNPAYQVSSMSPQHAFNLFMSPCAQADHVRDLILPSFPLLSYKLIAFYKLFGHDISQHQKNPDQKSPSRLHALAVLKAHISSQLYFYYELRNQFVHEADAFDAGDAPRLLNYAASLRAQVSGLLQYIRTEMQRMEASSDALSFWERLAHRYWQLSQLPLTSCATLFP